MTDEYTVDRRTVLQGLGATVIGTALAGCSEGPDEPDVSSDPNKYDYEFIPATDLLNELPLYRGDRVTTQTTVEWDGDYLTKEDASESYRLYEAHPDDAVQTFPVAEPVHGPVYELLGDEINDESHTDQLLQLYGVVHDVTDWHDDGYEAATSTITDALVVEDAELIDPATTETPGQNTTDGDQP